MESFLGVPITKINSSTNNYINLKQEFNIKNILATLFYCYSNKIPCIITHNNTILDKKEIGVYYIKDNIELFFDWDYLLSINYFFNKKYKIDENFTIKNNNLYLIFFIELIYANKKKYKNIGKNLCGERDSLFGVYDANINNLFKCEHILYFSYSIGKFIFYRVIDKDNAIYGKLMKGFYLKENKIGYKNSRLYNLPKSFKNISNNIFSIEKKIIDIVVDTDSIVKKTIYNQSYLDFLKYHNSRSIFLLDVKFVITKSILYKLYEFLILKYPILEDNKNNVLIDPYNLSMSNGNINIILLTNKSPNQLIVNIRQYFMGYITDIYNSIVYFFEEISITSTVSVQPINIQFNRDFCIHLISEVFYIYLIFKYLWKIQNNLILAKSDSYIQVNYHFSEKETNTLKTYAGGENYTDYIKYLICTILGTFLNNYYVCCHEETNINLIPIFEGIDITTIKKYFGYSAKANYSKYGLLTYLSKLFSKSRKDNYDIPIVLLNITNIPDNNKIKLSKIYASTDKHTIPIIVNISYNEKKLLINLSYKKEYKKMKYFFNELLENILDT